MNRRIATLFVAAVLGALTVVGLALSALGWPVLAGYLAAVAVALVLVLRKASTLRAVAPEDGRTCECCTSTVFDPIEVR